MDRIEFLKETVYNFDDNILEEIIEEFVDKYVSFSIIKKDEISKEVFIEKLADYFEKIEIQTANSFDKNLNKYSAKLNSLLKARISTEPPSRASNYFEKAIEIGNSKEKSTETIIDYTRIILCLYTAIIESEEETISDFSLSVDNIKFDLIIEKLKEEKTSEIDFFGIAKLGNKQLFNTDNLYSIDSFIFVVLFIVYYHLLNTKLIGGQI